MRAVGAGTDLGSQALVEATPVKRGGGGLAVLGIPFTGIGWSLGVFLARMPEIEALDVGPGRALFLIGLGGLSQTLALWVGFSAVSWAMVRVFGGRTSLLSMLVLISTSAMPLWIAAPAAAFWLDSAAPAKPAAFAIAIAGGAGFLALASRTLALRIGWHPLRAGAALAATVVFLASVVSLAG